MSVLSSFTSLVVLATTMVLIMRMIVDAFAFTSRTSTSFFIQRQHHEQQQKQRQLLSSSSCFVQNRQGVEWMKYHIGPMKIYTKSSSGNDDDDNDNVNDPKTIRNEDTNQEEQPVVVVTKEMLLLDLLKHPTDSDVYDDPEEDDNNDNNSNNNNNDDDDVKENHVTGTTKMAAAAAAATTGVTTTTTNTSADVRIKKKGNKNKNGGYHKEYKVFDNRDTMPFAVTIQTPDPYTHPDIKRKNVNQTIKKKKNAIEEQITSRIMMVSTSTSTSTSNKSKSKSKTKTTDTTTSSDNNDNNNNNNDDNDNDTRMMTLLGEYSLDKHTTTGDYLLINNNEYKVVRHRCLYKYVGGQRFVMVKKILEVKEVTRIQTEEYLFEQLRKS